jgi:hypothetical protein
VKRIAAGVPGRLGSVLIAAAADNDSDAWARASSSMARTGGAFAMTLRFEKAGPIEVVVMKAGSMSVGHHH